MNKNNYIKIKGKTSTAIVAVFTVIVFGITAGLGLSQALIYYGVIDFLLPESAQVQPYSIIPHNPPAASNIDRNVPEDTFKQVEAGEHNNTGNSDAADSGEYTAAQLFEKLSDTVVGIKVTRAGSTVFSDIIGSGVIISSDGFIITCAHVIEGADKVKVTVDDYADPEKSHEFEAKVYGADKPTDLAVLKIQRNQPFRYAPIGNSSELKIGQTVVAIGNPLGLIKSMTQGIVSGLQRDLREGSYSLPSIQTDAALNPGNSGCPLFDMYGNIVGIVNIKLIHTTNLDNLGFAISINEALPIIEELAKYGFVNSRAMLGITALEINAYNRAIYGISVSDGLFVDTVRPGSPAALSGLSRGDVITEIDGRGVARVSDIQNVIKDKQVGDEVTVTVVRYNNYGESRVIELRFELINAA
jgi:serine protease Do